MKPLLLVTSKIIPAIYEDITTGTDLLRPTFADGRLPACATQIEPWLYCEDFYREVDDLQMLAVRGSRGEERKMGSGLLLCN